METAFPEINLILTHIICNNSSLCSWLNGNNAHPEKKKITGLSMIKQDFLYRLDMNLEARMLLNAFYVWYVQSKSKLY